MQGNLPNALTKPSSAGFDPIDRPKPTGVVFDLLTTDQTDTP
jgi:hypothetical protein